MTTPRQLARQKGEATYMPDKPCRTFGHMSPRRSDSGACIACLEQSRKRSKPHPHGMDKRFITWYPHLLIYGGMTVEQMADAEAWLKTVMLNYCKEEFGVEFGVRPDLELPK